MLYSSKLVNDVIAKQALADDHFAGFSVEVQHAIELAEHFEHVHAEQYVLPARWFLPAPPDEQHIIASEASIWAGSYSRL